MLFGKKQRPLVAPSEEWLTECRLSGLVKTEDTFVQDLFRPDTWKKPELGARHICLILVNLVEENEKLWARLRDLEAKVRDLEFTVKHLEPKLGASESQ